MTSTRADAALQAATRRPLLMPHHPLHRFYTGGAMTRRFRRVPNPADSEWSEDWVASTTTANNRDPAGHSQGPSAVALDDGTERTLDELIHAHPGAMLGAASLHRYGPVTGVLVKILSPSGPVPLHAHPTRAWARQHLRSRYGKTEAWILLDTPTTSGQSAHAGIGFKEGVTRDWFTDAIHRRDHDALRDSLHHTDIAAGEVYVAAAGVPHLLGPRELFIEVQEPSDHIVIPQTDGSDDAGATMGLGWDAALDMIDYTPVTAAAALSRARQVPTLRRREGESREFDLFAPWVGEYFQSRRLDVADTLTVDDDRFSVLIVTDGTGYLEGEFGQVPITAGDAYAVPAAAPHRLRAGVAPLTAIRCLGPNPENPS